MPKIISYSWNKKLIPVDEAKIITSYKCPWTNQIFSDKRSYLKHLRDYRKNWIYPMIRKNKHAKLKNQLWAMNSFEDIIGFLEANPKLILDNVSFWDDRQKKKFNKDDFWFKITFLSLTFNTRVSNSHCAPHNGVTNFTRKKEFPTSYPGWEGQIEYQTRGLPGAALGHLRIHTGTGGGISDNRHGYGVKFFNDDWPALWPALSEMITMKMLANDHSPTTFRMGTPVYFR